MDLIYDWKSFQTLFYAKRRAPQPKAQEPLYLVTEGRVVISAYSEGADFSEWIGTTYDEVVAEFSNRELVLFEREKVDEWMSQSTTLTHFYDQIQYLRSEAKPKLQKHFLLDAIQSWWHKIFPSTYGIYIRLDGVQGTSLLLIIQRGRLDSFHVPDLSSMIPERRSHSLDVVRFLADRHLVPIQGVFLTTAEWTEWSESANPWPRIVSALRASRSKLVPFNWTFALLILIRAYFGL